MIMLKKTRRTFTLLELIIAMTLTLIIMSTLLYFYRDLSTIGIETNKLNDTHFYWQYAGSRLADIIPKTVIKDDKEEYPFYSLEDSSLTKQGSQSLIFAFDNKISLDKLFSNTVVGRLYVDKSDQLTLAYWPPQSRWGKKDELPPMKKEILKQNVESISFEFFVPPEKSVPKKAGVSTSGSEPVPKGAWWTQPWQRDFNSLPAMVKMTIIPKKQTPPVQPVTYIFPLINTNAHILYD